MDLDTLLKAIVPLAFLAIWALTAVFNKDGSALPARGQAAPNPYGPRPPVPPRVAGPPDRQPPLRWSPQNVAPGPPRPGGGDDDIVILESSRPSRHAPARNLTPRRLRPKPAPVVAAKPAPIVPTKLGLGNVSQTVNQQLATPLAIEPLTAHLPGVTVRPLASGPAKAVDHIGDPTSRAMSVAAALTDPRRLREAILVNELLQPPLALRRGPGRRR